VNYPLHELDLSSYVKSPSTEAPIYDLYAVSNHYGSLGGGHYTAFGQNKNDQKWYKFDDSSVSKMDENKVRSSSAYVLFYRRRGSVDPNETNNTNSTTNNNNSPTNNNVDHMDSDGEDNNNNQMDTTPH